MRCEKLSPQNAIKYGEHVRMQDTKNIARFELFSAE